MLPQRSLKGHLPHITRTEALERRYWRRRTNWFASDRVGLLYRQDNRTTRHTLAYLPTLPPPQVSTKLTVSWKSGLDASDTLSSDFTEITQWRQTVVSQECVRVLLLGVQARSMLFGVYADLAGAGTARSEALPFPKTPYSRWRPRRKRERRWGGAWTRWGRYVDQEADHGGR
jgi:hypothetical protein